MAELPENTWIGVDFDGTLSTYYGWTDPRNGQPIKPMVNRVKGWLKDGKIVKIFTARVSSTNKNKSNIATQRTFIQDWCEKHLGQRLEVTCEKDHLMLEIWDDRAHQVLFNRGHDVADLDPNEHTVQALLAAAEKEMKSSFDKLLPD